MKKRTEESPERSTFWRGTLFGMFTGVISLLLYQYFRGILLEPRLITKALFSDEQQFETKEALAMFIAAESLRAGVRTRYLTRDVSKRIIHAGYRNFRESWARDFGFAAYGMLVIKQFEIVKETLEAFFWHQTKAGQFPVKLHSMNVVTRFLHSLLEREQPTQRILIPKYFSGHGAPSLDSEAMLIICALHYVNETKDDKFLQKNWDILVLAMKWLKSHATDQSVLLLQESFSDWADSIDRHGHVLYTNVLYWKTLVEMSHKAADLNHKDLAADYLSEAENILQALNERLWRPELGYFATSETLNNLSSDGNLLAIVWGLASAEQTASILRVMDETRMAEPVPTRVAYPSYSPELIAIENYIGGVANYHTDASWLWLGAWHLIALTHSGAQERAQTVLGHIVDVIVRDQQINEVHGPDGRPLSSFWYKSEAPLIWNAGMVLYACQIYNEKFHTENNMLSILTAIRE